MGLPSTACQRARCGDGTLARLVWRAPAAAVSQRAVEQLDDDARAVLARAGDEASSLRHNYIGTEHLVLALLRAEDAISAVLTRSGVSAGGVRAEIERIVGPGRSTGDGDLPLTPRAATAIDLARREAERLGRSSAGPGHLLLGLLDQVESVGAKVINRLGVDSVALRHLVHDCIDPPGAVASEAWPRTSPRPFEPLCPACRQPLLSGLDVRSVFVDQVDDPRWVDLAYCRACGTTIGVVP